MISVALIEDDSGITEEVEKLIGEDAGCSLVCSCRNVQTALAQVPHADPDVVLVDINLPDGSGIDATARLKRILPRSEFMMFTVYEDSEEIFRALEAGASGYLLKRTAPEKLIESIHEVRNGGVPMTGEVARRVVRSFRKKPVRRETIEHLTKREEEILELLAKGYLYKEIAERLSISAGTVNSHLKNVYSKLHVRSRTEAVLKYLK